MFRSFSSVHVVASPVGARTGEKVTEFCLAEFERRVSAGAPLAQAIRDANLAVLARIEEQPELRGGGCALAAISVQPTAVDVAWLGDVRVYRLRGGELRRLTRDHSLKNATDGAVDRPDVIVRAVGMPDVDVEARVLPREPGDVFALLSDTVYRMVGDERVGEILVSASTAADACNALLDAAALRRGRDALSALVVFPA